MSEPAPRSRTLARALCDYSFIVDVPHPDEPGMRVIGFRYLEAQASMTDAMRALTLMRDAFKAKAYSTSD